VPAPSRFVSMSLEILCSLKFSFHNPSGFLMPWVL
jgi:hypothetical protein